MSGTVVRLLVVKDARRDGAKEDVGALGSQRSLAFALGLRLENCSILSMRLSVESNLFWILRVRDVWEDRRSKPKMHQ